MYFIAVMEPVKQPVAAETTENACCAHARHSQPAGICPIVLLEPGDSLISSCFLLDYRHFLAGTENKEKGKKDPQVTICAGVGGTSFSSTGKRERERKERANVRLDLGEVGSEGCCCRGSGGKPIRGTQERLDPASNRPFKQRRRKGQKPEPGL